MLKVLFKMKNNPITFLMTLSMTILILILSSENSSAQSSTRQRLTAIEKQLNAIQRKVFTPGSRFQSANAGADKNSVTDAPIGSEGALIADINIRISELEIQIRQMTGQLEEANFKVTNMTRKLETMEKDYEFRFKEIENGTRNGNGSMSGGASSVLNNVSTPVAFSTPKQQYDQAYGLVSSGNYAAAEISLLEFLESHPKDKLAGNAQYWLGQTYYARSNYASAARAFLEGMSKYPKSPKAPAYLLKVGMSLSLLGEKSEACEVFRELNTQFPQSTENTRMRATEERKAGCN